MTESIKPENRAQPNQPKQNGNHKENQPLKPTHASVDNHKSEASLHQDTPPTLEAAGLEVKPPGKRRHKKKSKKTKTSLEADNKPGRESLEKSPIDGKSDNTKNCTIDETNDLKANVLKSKNESNPQNPDGDPSADEGTSVDP